ncbi:MAG: aminoglycoside phosphotransferase family protein [Betaproteobacteria bacterium]
MQDEQPTIDAALARRLVAEQFPHWAHLPVRAMPTQGWDKRSFLLGSGMVLRLPSAQAYAAQVPREQRWLPYLRRHLPVEIPQPLAQGRPGCGYPFAWSVYRWIDGDTVASRPPSDLHLFVTDLARFLNALRAVPAADGPAAGEDNFHRGGALDVYDAEAREAVAVLRERIDAEVALRVWDAGLASAWAQPPVWVHGDIAPGNLLVRAGRLAAVIDFGQLAVGDPACDLAIAWSYLRAPQRETFRATLGLDAATWQRGKAWALWKAAIMTAGIAPTTQAEEQASKRTLDEVLATVAG